MFSGSSLAMPINCAVSKQYIVIIKQAGIRVHYRGAPFFYDHHCHFKCVYFRDQLHSLAHMLLTIHGTCVLICSG